MKNKQDKIQRIMCYISVVLLVVIISWLLFQMDACAIQNEECQEKAHEIAELARALDLSEDNPIITEAQRIWLECERQCKRSDDYTDEEIHHLANAIYFEAGNGCTEEHQLLVGAVVMNRVDSPDFPNTIDEVLSQPRQYRIEYVNETLELPEDRREEFEELARRAINGEPCDCIDEVVFQSQCRQGDGIYKTYDCYLDGKYYSTTYFCY